MKKVLVGVMALLLVALPVTAQQPQEAPLPGTLLVMVGVYDGVDFIPADEYLLIPPLACDPS